MPEEKEVQQRELFKEFSEKAKRPSRFSWLKKSLSFRPLVFVFSYEKFIFFIIGLLIILAIVFCLGVEEGKKLSREVTPTNLVTPVTPPQAVVPPLTPSPVLPSSVVKKEEFSVQLASFSERTSAEKELSNLKNKGYQAFIVSSGKYYVVGVGFFSNKGQAQAVLTKLKTTYKDAYIKKR